MKVKAFMMALKFACLPTLSLLILLFFGFFSISKTIDFIASNNGWAVFLRILCVVMEIVLIWFMYDKYLKEESLKTAGKIVSSGDEVRMDKEICRCFGDTYNSKNKYYVHRTEHSDVIVIKRNIKIIEE